MAVINLIIHSFIFKYIYPTFLLQIRNQRNVWLRNEQLATTKMEKRDQSGGGAEQVEKLRN